MNVTIQEYPIFIIGGRACGKSTIGRELAKKLAMNFLDMDTIIEDEEGCKIQELVADKGWTAFRKKEEMLLRRLAHSSPCVIATGGGTILHQDIWPTILQRSFVVWLRACSAAIRRRLQADSNTCSQRPSLTGENVLSEAEKIMAEREPLYRNGSHIQVDSEQPLEVVVEQILKAFREKIKFRQESI